MVDPVSYRPTAAQSEQCHEYVIGTGGRYIRNYSASTLSMTSSDQIFWHRARTQPDPALNRISIPAAER